MGYSFAEAALIRAALQLQEYYRTGEVPGFNPGYESRMPHAQFAYIRKGLEPYAGQSKDDPVSKVINDLKTIEAACEKKAGITQSDVNTYIDDLFALSALPEIGT